MNKEDLYERYSRNHDREMKRRLAFREKCQKILDVLGTPDHMGRRYQDEDMTIMSGSWACGLKMEVSILPKSHPQNLHNPVVMVDTDGECIRHHGEWFYIEDHVNEVYEKAQQEAISLGLG